ncbi:MAG: hypothetical protein JNN05_04565 [Candidatus Omnitrophica bacterium]|nr:hypothetical protein [Candidatus Omnitrophota bacterium]
MNFGLTHRQSLFNKAFFSGSYKYLCAAGTAGSGKSVLTIGDLHYLAKKISGLRFAVIRKSEKNLKLTSIPTFNKVKMLSRSVNSSVIVDMSARYPNGSDILFIWADPTKDPDLDNVKGLELTGALIEEANQIDRRYFEILKTRIGRWNNHKCPAFILLNLNPSLGWVKEVFYDNFINNTLPPEYFFMQFDKRDAEKAAGREYVKQLEDLPPEEYRRYVQNNWDYSEIPNQLVQYEWYKQCIAPQPEIDPLIRAIGAIDPAWEGDDATGFGFMHGNHMGWWESYDKQDPDYSGDLGYQRAQEHFVKRGDLIVDPIGVGAATALRLSRLKFEPDLFYAGSPPVNTYGLLEAFNKRSEAGWLFREALRNEEITITHDPDFQRHVLAMRYSIDEKKIRIRPKDEVKKEIGESPTYFDLAQMLTHKWKTTNGELAKQLFERQTAVKTPTISTRAAADRARIIKQGRIGV